MARDSSDLDSPVLKYDLEEYVLFDLLSHYFFKNLRRYVRIVGVRNFQCITVLVLKVWSADH
jgi:hypothetical protein